MPRTVLCALLSLLALGCGWAEEPAAKPPIRTADDGFPCGSDTPEGAACDLARAFIRRNDALFLKVCIPPYGSPETKQAYQDYLDTVGAEMKSGDPQEGGPKKLGKCFAARHLSKSGPALYGAATFGFQDVVFVDVGVFLEDSRPQLCRTLVIKDKAGKWMAHPRPNLSPLLCEGLNEEGASAVDFAQVYTVN